MMKFILTMVPLLVVLALVPVARAEDVFPPPWESPFPTETYQAWEFSTPDVIAFPEVVNNPYGEPFIEIVNGDDYGVNEGLDGTYTTWHVGPPSGIHHIQIHNNPNEGIRKEVFIQITSTGAPTSVTAPAHPGATVTTPYQPKDWGGGWFTFDYLVTIPGNPAMDYIDLEFPFCTYIEEIVVHTRCVPVPEPGLLAVVGLGGLLFFRKRKK